MSERPPGGLRDRLTSPVGIAVAIGCLLILAYSLLIAQQLLLGLLVVLAVVGLYVAFRLIRAIEGVADALDRQTDVALDVRGPASDEPGADQQTGTVGHGEGGPEREPEPVRGTDRDASRGRDRDGNRDRDRDQDGDVTRNADPELE